MEEAGRKLGEVKLNEPFISHCISPVCKNLHLLLSHNGTSISSCLSSAEVTISEGARGEGGLDWSSGLSRSTVLVNP